MATSSSGRFSVALEVGPQNGLQKEKGLDLGAEPLRIKPFMRLKANWFLVWYILFNIYDVPTQTGPLRCKF